MDGTYPNVNMNLKHCKKAIVLGECKRVNFGLQNFHVGTWKFGETDTESYFLTNLSFAFDKASQDINWLQLRSSFCDNFTFVGFILDLSVKSWFLLEIQRYFNTNSFIIIEYLIHIKYNFNHFLFDFWSNDVDLWNRMSFIMHFWVEFQLCFLLFSN